MLAVLLHLSMFLVTAPPDLASAVSVKDAVEGHNRVRIITAHRYRTMPAAIYGFRYLTPDRNAPNIKLDARTDRFILIGDVGRIDAYILL